MGAGGSMLRRQLAEKRNAMPNVPAREPAKAAQQVAPPKTDAKPAPAPQAEPKPAPLSHKAVMALGKDRVQELAKTLGVKADGLSWAGLCSAVSQASGYVKAAPQGKGKAAPKAVPAAGTVWVADGKGGYRSPGQDDLAVLMALVDAMTAPAAAA
jgi:hypothetical protein